MCNLWNNLQLIEGSQCKVEGGSQVNAQFIPKHLQNRQAILAKLIFQWEPAILVGPLMKRLTSRCSTKYSLIGIN